jgi:hypothetical protein
MLYKFCVLIPLNKTRCFDVYTRQGKQLLKLSYCVCMYFDFLLLVLRFGNPGCVSKIRIKEIPSVNMQL